MSFYFFLTERSEGNRLRLPWQPSDFQLPIPNAVVGIAIMAAVDTAVQCESSSIQRVTNFLCQYQV